MMVLQYPCDGLTSRHSPWSSASCCCLLLPAPCLPRCPIRHPLRFSASWHALPARLHPCSVWQPPFLLQLTKPVSHGTTQQAVPVAWRLISSLTSGAGGGNGGPRDFAAACDGLADVAAEGKQGTIKQGVPVALGAVSSLTSGAGGGNGGPRGFAAACDIGAALADAAAGSKPGTIKQGLPVALGVVRSLTAGAGAPPVSFAAAGDVEGLADAVANTKPGMPQ
jgi:hypothetical protein